MNPGAQALEGITARHEADNEDRSSKRDAAATPDPGLPLGTAATCVVPACPGRLAAEYDVAPTPAGKGGYAVVHRATRRADGRVVAVKRVEVFEMSARKRERCLQEVVLLAQLRHPAIIAMLDAFVDDGALIIVFEWAPAGDLKRLLHKASHAGRPLDEPTIWHYLAQVVDGLRYMHGRRIMHRDIKPANVLVGVGGRLKLGDLGLGRQLSEQTLAAFSKVGTPYYVAPEVVRGAGYDWKSDVWSLGCLLYELACLRSPFEQAADGAVALADVFRHVAAGVFDPIPASAALSETLVNLVGRMLRVDPSERLTLEEVHEVAQRALGAMAAVADDSDAVLLSERLHARLVVMGAPAPLLRLLHPACFACCAGASKHVPGQGRTDGQVHDGASLPAPATMAWLLRLGGWPQHASAVEGASLVGAAASGETMRAAAAAIGLDVEFMPAAALARGCGCVVIALLQGVVDAVQRRLPPGMPAVGKPAARQPDTEDEEQELEAEDSWSRDALFAAEAVQSSTIGSPSQTQSSAALPGEVGIDPAAWRAEAERLAPHLDRIRIKASVLAVADGGGGALDTSARWERTHAALLALRADTGPTLVAARQMAASVAEQLEQIAAVEVRLAGNGAVPELLAHYAERRAQLAQLHADVAAQEQLQLLGHVALAGLGERVALTQERIDACVAGLDGTLALQQLRDSIQALSAEMRAMDVRTGVLHAELMSRRLREKPLQYCKHLG